MVNDFRSERRGRELLSGCKGKKKRASEASPMSDGGRASDGLSTTSTNGRALRKSRKSAFTPLYEQDKPYFVPPRFNEQFLQAVYPHIASFNTFTEFFLPELVKDLSPIYVDPAYDRNKHELDPFYTPVEYLKVYIRKVVIGKPIRYDSESQPLWPRECRNGHSTYAAPLYVEFVHDNARQKEVLTITKRCGRIPIMVSSNRCHLEGLGPEDMMRHGEECNEAGGYFIINGNERIIRFVVQQRCNHPIALRKARFAERDLFFTDSAVLMRCARRDGTSTANILFYTEDRQCVFRVLINRQEVVVPYWTLLRALMPELSMELIKKKLFETEYQDAAASSIGTGDAAEKMVMRVVEMNMLWKDFVDQETLFCDLDKYENRYLHQLGKLYWDLIGSRLKPGSRYEDAGRYVINKYILVHCDSWSAKLETLILMYRKLMELVRGEIAADNIDSFAYQEVITPGQLFASVLKDALYNALLKIKLSYGGELRIAEAAAEDPTKVVRSREQFELILRRVSSEISHTLSYFMSTGNIKTHQLDLQQLSGWTVVADRLNVNRFLSHFRAVHRGQFFAQMRTTEVRKLLGETWGFLCPVHTPDGGPCGLLLHLAQGAIPVTEAPDGKAMAALKVYLHRRNIPTDLNGHYLTAPVPYASTFPLVFDGQPLCRLPTAEFDYWVDHLRWLKQSGQHGIPPHLEVAAFKRGSRAFEGIFVFSYPGRLVRSVKHLGSNKLEWIGPLGQPWMDIACVPKEVDDARLRLAEQKVQLNRFIDRPEDEPVPKAVSFKDVIEDYKCNQKDTSHTRERDPEQKSIKAAHEHHSPSGNSQIVPVAYTHVELSPNMILSITSALTPFSDHNQSPRNMYQCQMLKQTMATPFHSIPCRTDNKAYRLLFPQRPLVRTKEYRDFGFDEYPSGTNAIVAVIAHTGFDMEDAMILNKASLERGAFHATVYKTKLVDAAPVSAKGAEARNYVFNNATLNGEPIVNGLGTDGLPVVGTRLTRDSPLYRTTTVDALASDSTARSVGHVTTYHDDEVCYVDKVNFIAVSEGAKDNRAGGAKGSTLQRASIRLRCVRNPIVGDKFASRAGQKGILSMLWSHEDMPFTGSGIVPDIVFNPHGFPSRMTVGMLIESMAGKAGAVHGSYQDCTPFRTFPRQQKSGNKWIDQGGYHGWIQRDSRYMTKEEDDNQTTDTSVDYFGKALLNAGYQYYGTEPLYSGIHGVEMECHIFMGVIYYQRLRHMVSDKWQVRATGPIDVLTRQPVKGRKRGGGVRFGEMERDAILAHGASCLLQDRLMHCADEHIAFVCPSCGSILSPSLKTTGGRTVGGKKPVAECRVCNVPCRLISLPFVFRYVCNELASMNVTIRLQLSERDKVLQLKEAGGSSSAQKNSSRRVPRKAVNDNNRAANTSALSSGDLLPSSAIDRVVSADVDSILGSSQQRKIVTKDMHEEDARTSEGFSESEKMESVSDS